MSGSVSQIALFLLSLPQIFNIMDKISRLLLCFFCLCQVSICLAQDEALFNELDRLLANQPQLTQEKEHKIKIIKEGLSEVGMTQEQEYAINNRLYSEYLAFKYDSAYKYVHKNLEIAKRLGNSHLYHESVLNMVHVLSAAGLFDHAHHLIDTINEKDLEGNDLQAYYQSCSDLYLFSSEFSVGTTFYLKNLENAQIYRQKLRKIVGQSDSFVAICNRADLTAWEGKNKQALLLLERYLKTHQIRGGRNYSIICSMMAFYCQKLGDKEMQKEYLLKTAISDVENCIRENNSLRELASFLFEEGDIDRAYKYLNASVQDANFYGTRLRNAQVAQFVPKIIQKYYEDNNSHRKLLSSLLLVTLCISAFLVVALIFMRRYLLRYRQEKEKTEKTNQLLKDNMGQVEKANTFLKHHSDLKEQYIGRFMELVTEIIACSENQRKQANRLARDHKLKELYDLLKSNDFVMESTKLFNKNFDEAFLNIYPDFVEKLNELMLPEYRYSTDKMSLNTELRILALIRLGITDNQKIASILQSSITTIYTYRSKLKGHSVFRSDFEQKVLEIDA